MPSIINSTTSSGLVTSADNSGSLQLATNNGTTAVTIDTSQNVGIGTATPATKLDINTGTGATALSIRATSSTGGVLALGINASTGNASIGGAVNGIDIATTVASPITFLTNNTSRAAITSSGDFQMNSGYGSAATAYGCRAWVNFNGTGTVAIRASGNVSSITDNGTGDYTVNFTTAMPDANYSTNISAQTDASGFVPALLGVRNGGAATGSVRIDTLDNAPSRRDFPAVYVAIFR